MSMNALEFLRERKRMCGSYKDCKGCPFNGSKCVIDSTVSDDDCERIAATVEQWSKAHPRKTRQSEFLKQWPNAQFDENDNIKVCPKLLMGVAPSNNGQGCVCSCYTCREDFWSQEVE